MPDPGWPGYDLKGAKCPDLGEGYGPYDYTNPNHRGHNLKVVEHSHFNNDVETLKKGMSDHITGDLTYTIRSFPNHHRALYAMMRYQLLGKPITPPKAGPIECYLQRAIKFKPSDYRVMQLYASYLIKKKFHEKALAVYNQAIKIKNAPPNINYSLGLLYFDMKRYDDAVAQAKIAYAGGIKKSKLASKLKKINRWPTE